MAILDARLVMALAQPAAQTAPTDGITARDWLSVATGLVIGVISMLTAVAMPGGRGGRRSRHSLSLRRGTGNGARRSSGVRSDRRNSPSGAVSTLNAMRS
jgi:hypothetical protein